MLNYAIIGFGGLGKFHFQNLLKIQKQRGDICLKAICNSDIESITKPVSINNRDVSVETCDFSKYNLYTDYKEMMKSEKPDFVFVALPTYLHCEVSVYCMEHGAHVFCEKPMAVNLDECRKMIEASEKHDKKLMIGHCLRLEEGYSFLKDAVQKGTYGKAVRAEFYRKSPLPAWSHDNWMLNESKSGGCVVDMAAHDIDIVNWVFGAPQKISSACGHKMAAYESVYAILDYGQINVLINCDWGLHSTYKFKAGYNVTFENAHIEYSCNKITVITNDDTEEIILEGGNYHLKEAEEFVEAIISDRPFETIGTDSVFESMKLLFAIKGKSENA